MSREGVGDSDPLTQPPALRPALAGLDTANGFLLSTYPRANIAEDHHQLPVAQRKSTVLTMRRAGVRIPPGLGPPKLRARGPSPLNASAAAETAARYRRVLYRRSTSSMASCVVFHATSTARCVTPRSALNRANRLPSELPSGSRSIDELFTTPP